MVQFVQFHYGKVQSNQNTVIRRNYEKEVPSTQITRTATERSEIRNRLRENLKNPTESG